MSIFKKIYNPITLSSFTATLLMLAVIVFLFNFNLEAFKAGAAPGPVVGTGAPGYIAKWITATVPTVSLSASPTSVPLSTSTTLTWSGIVNATSCTASSTNNDWTGSKSIAGGSDITTPTSTETYTLTCTGPSGTTPASVTVTVTAAPTSAGACLATHYGCTNGTDDTSTNKSNTSNWTWTCDGISGGSNTSCSQLKTALNPIEN